VNFPHLRCLPHRTRSGGECELDSCPWRSVSRSSPATRPGNEPRTSPRRSRSTATAASILVSAGKRRPRSMTSAEVEEGRGPIPLGPVAGPNRRRARP